VIVSFVMPIMADEQCLMLKPGCCDFLLDHMEFKWKDQVKLQSCSHDLGGGSDHLNQQKL